MRSAAGYSFFAIAAFAIGVFASFNDAPGHIVIMFLLAGVAYSCTAAILRALDK